MSKVLEKLVVKRLENHMCTNNLYDSLQSAYRSQHSTETAILKIHNDIIEGLDASKCTVLSSLDLSAAFDTVDHTICIRRLSHLYGVGTVLQWFESFLSNRDNKVCVNDVFTITRCQLRCTTGLCFRRTIIYNVCIPIDNNNSATWSPISYIRR